MLIGDPLSEGSSASSTNRRPITELWGAAFLVLIVQSERNSDFQQGAACS